MKNFFAIKVTRNEKNMAGRSMIEMLGVLAIVAILSAGGIWGYSLAMENYKVNKTINTFIQVAQQSAYFLPSGDTSGTDDLCKLKVIPDEICKKGTGDYRKGYFDENISFQYFPSSSGASADILKTDGTTVKVSTGRKYLRILTTFAYSQTACAKLLSHHAWKKLFASVIDVSTMIGYLQLPLKPSAAEKACSTVFSRKEHLRWMYFCIYTTKGTETPVRG